MSLRKCGVDLLARTITYSSRKLINLIVPHIPNHFVDNHRLNPENGHPIAINSTFESVIGPLFKFREWEFADAAAADVNPNAASAGDADANRTRFKDAINSIRTRMVSSSGNETMTTKIRNVEMLTLGANDAGLPIRRYFDWNIGSLTEGEQKVVIMYGDVVNEAESSDR